MKNAAKRAASSVYRKRLQISRRTADSLMAMAALNVAHVLRAETPTAVVAAARFAAAVVTAAAITAKVKAVAVGASAAATRSGGFPYLSTFSAPPR